MTAASASLQLNRKLFPAQLAELEFEMLVPDGFITPEMPREDVDFSDPTKSAPLAVVTSQVALALIAVAARPAYEDGTVLQWLRFLASHFKIDLQHVQVHEESEGQPGRITAFGTQFQEGTRLNLMIVAFEDADRFVTAHAMCPVELWPSFGDALSRSVESIRLTQPKGSRHPLDNADARENERTAFGMTGGGKEGVLEDLGELDPETLEHVQGAMQVFANAEKYREASRRAMEERREAREPAVAKATKLLREDKFEEAEQAIMQVDQSIEGGGAIAGMYEARLRELVEQQADKDTLETVFGRALRWAQHCYPEPHTQDEADAYERGRVEDRSRLVQILGYDPDA
jgi:hypothetical protein